MDKDKQLSATNMQMFKEQNNQLYNEFNAVAEQSNRLGKSKIITCISFLYLSFFSVTSSDLIANHIPELDISMR